MLAEMVRDCDFFFFIYVDLTGKIYLMLWVMVYFKKKIGWSYIRLIYKKNKMTFILIFLIQYFLRSNLWVILTFFSKCIYEF